MSAFESIVGFKYLRGLHLNDSKYGLSSHKDRHENIGMGEIGLEAFRLLMNDSRLDGVPMCLETPTGDNPEIWKEEIAALYELEGREQGNWIDIKHKLTVARENYGQGKDTKRKPRGAKGE